MRRTIILAFVLSTLAVVNTFAVLDLSQSDSEIPIEIGSQNIYIEKFSPIYIQDISEEQLELLGVNDKKEGLGDFLAVLENYNKVFYRKFNTALETNIANLKNSEKIKTIYLRDFNENDDESIRYIISNNYSIVDIYLASKSARQDDEDKLGYYVYDKETKTKHKMSYDLTTLLLRLDAYYDLKGNGKLQDFTQESLDKMLNKIEFEAPKERRFSKVSWGVFIFAGVAILTNLLLNN